MSCAVAPTQSTRSARYEKTYRAPQRTYRLEYRLTQFVGCNNFEFRNNLSNVTEKTKYY